MTTIRTVEDLLTALREQPELLEAARSVVLTDELLTLPQRVSALTERVNDLTVQVSALTAIVMSLAETVREYIERSDARFDRLESDVGTLKADVGTLKADVGTLKADVGTLKGNDLERRARENILNIAKDELGLTRGRVLLSRTRDMDPALLSTLEQAESAGLITEDEVDNLEVADIIIRGRRRSDRQYIYAVVEVSRTIRQSDIDRAHDRARTLADATGDESIAVAMGSIIQPQQQELADRKGVQVVMPAMLREEQ